jgi:hypothetical protein
MTDDYEDYDPLSIEPLTVTVGDDIDWDNMGTITISDTSTATDTFSILTDTITFDDTTWTTNPDIKIGKYTITEEKLEKLDALLEAIDLLSDENDLKSLLDNVRILKKLKNED